MLLGSVPTDLVFNSVGNSDRKHVELDKVKEKKILKRAKSIRTGC
jgi:hypothetical protein